MRIRRNFINKEFVEFLEIGAFDYEELYTKKEHPATNISIEMDALECLQFFPDIQHLILRPGNIQKDSLKYLLGLPIISLKLDYYSYATDDYCIDLSYFPRLQYIFSRTQFNVCNAEKCSSLRTLIVQEWFDSDLLYLQKSHLQALAIYGGNLKTVKGVGSMPNLLSLSLSNMRKLTNIDELNECPMIESLSIENCNKIMVDSIPCLPKLRFLQLLTRQEVNDFLFVTKFPLLDYLITDVKSIDGDLSPLYRLTHCAIMTDHRHYSVKNKDLPKAVKKFQSDHVAKWLQILPEN